MEICALIFVVIYFQGTWFIQVAFILYSPFGSNWDLDNHQEMMQITIIYAWHFLTGLFTVSLLGLLALVRVKNLSANEAYEAVEKSSKNFDFIQSALKEDSYNEDEQTKYMISISDEDEV